jgi:glycosyltransferase involved in cell wall biosynthesis
MNEYVVVTPCKNEEKNILLLAESMASQTLLPRLWVILDDGSTDSTPSLLRDLAFQHDWIYVCTLGRSERDVGFHIGEITNYGFDLAIKLCDKQCNYIGMIDADMILCEDFFERIIDKLENDPSLGVAGGTVAYEKASKIIPEKGRSLGGLMVWRTKCLFDIGGYPVSYSADSVSCVMAIQKGWKVAKFDDALGVQTRKTSSAEGLWKGYRKRGESDYYRGYQFFYAFLKSIKYILKFPFYTGIAYFYGYVYGIIKIKNRIENSEVRIYYQNKQKELIGYYAGKILHKK